MAVWHDRQTKNKIHIKSFFTALDDWSSCPTNIWLLPIRTAPDDVKFLWCQIVRVCFHNRPGYLNPVPASPAWPQSQSNRWEQGKKAPLTDLRAMSIKLDCHVLSVMHSHAAPTPRRSLVNLSPAGPRFQTSVFILNSPTFMLPCFFVFSLKNIPCSTVCYLACWWPQPIRL